MTANKEALHVIGQLYDAATDMDKWPLFLESLAALFNAPHVNLLHFDAHQERFNLYLERGNQTPPDAVEAFQALFTTDPRAVACNRLPGKPMSCRQILTDEEWHNTKTYHLMRGLEDVSDYKVIEYSLCVTLPEENGMQTGLALMREATGDAFTQEECDLLGDIIPHLKRAMSLQKTFVEMDFSRQVAHNTLDHLPIGLVVADENGGIVFANSVAHEIAKKKKVLTLDHDRIHALNKEQNLELKGCIGSVIRNARQNKARPGANMVLTGKNGRKKYPVMVSALWGNHVKLGLGILDAPLAAIFITDPARPQEAPIDLLQRLYGLTPSEAAVVERLVAGRTVKEASIDLSLTEGSARQYLKSVFQKTGTHRQTELVRLVMGSPVWTAHIPSPTDP